MAIIRDAITKESFSSDELVDDFFSKKTTKEQSSLKSEYDYGKDYSAWVEEFISKYNILSPKGNVFDTTKQENASSKIVLSSITSLAK